MSDKPSVTRVRDGKKVAGAAQRGKAGARVGRKPAPVLKVSGRPDHWFSTAYPEVLVLDLFDPDNRHDLRRVVLLYALALDAGVSAARLGRVDAIRAYLLPYLDRILFRLPAEHGEGAPEEFVIADPGRAHVRRHAGSEGLDQERRIARLEVMMALRPGATSDERAQKAEAQKRLGRVVFRTEWRAAALAVSEFIDVARSVADELEQGEDKPEGGFVSLVEDLMHAWDSCAIAVMRPFLLESLRDRAARRKNPFLKRVAKAAEAGREPAAATPEMRQLQLHRYMAANNLDSLSPEQRTEQATRFGVTERTIRNYLKALEEEGPSRGLPWPPKS